MIGAMSCPIEVTIDGMEAVVAHHSAHREASCEEGDGVVAVVGSPLEASQNCLVVVAAVHR
jgi:hypothetical protein